MNFKIDTSRKEPGPAFQCVERSFSGGAPGSRTPQSFSLRPGLTLTVVDPPAEGPLRIFSDAEETPVQFGFIYRGHYRCTYSSGALCHQCHEMSSGSNGIFYLPRTSGYVERPGNDPACLVGVAASTHLLRTYFQEDMEQLPKGFRSVLEGKSTAPMVWFGPRHQVKHGILMQIIDCPYRGGMRKLFLENRAIELLTFQLNDYIVSESGRIVPPPPLRPADVERIRVAKEILVKDMENPPTIPELAAKVGINEKKLKIGFRQVFNTSVFGYFREYRLQRAYEFLRDADTNVTETAYTVGYQSLSHFSQSFRRRFGLAPKDFQARHRRRGDHKTLEKAGQ